MEVGLPGTCRWDQVFLVGPRIKNHTTTLVGKHLYVFGGYDGQNNNNQVHRFDCENMTWEMLSPNKENGRYPKGRNGHTATYAEGKIFIIGGWLGSGPLAADDLSVLDLAKNSWFFPVVSGKSPGACNMHTVDFVPHKRALFVFRGGDGRRYLNDLHLFDIDLYRWDAPEVSGTAPAPRANHSSALVGEKLYFFGGWDGNRRLNDIHILCTRELNWTKPVVHGIPPSPRAGMTLTCVRGLLYLFGGSGPQATCFKDLQVFNPETSTWLVTETRNKATSGNSSSHDEQKQAPLGGGGMSSRRDRIIENTASLSLDSMRRENPNSMNANTTKADVFIAGNGPSERAGHTATLVGRNLLIFGGSCVEDYLGDMHVLNTDSPPTITVSGRASSSDRLSTLLPTYLNNPSFSDVTFKVEGKSIHAHKMILSLASEHFERMFSKDQGFMFVEAQQNEIEIPDLNYAAFLKALEYLYTGKLNVGSKSERRRQSGGEAASNAQANDTPVTKNGFGGWVGGENSQSARGEDRLPSSLTSSANKGFGILPTHIHAHSQEPVDLSEMNSLAEILCVADRFVLEHLKQLCELRLSKFLRKETVDTLEECAEMSNANQLLDLCAYFRRMLADEDTFIKDPWVL